jgi:hypothetical protein
VKNGNGIDKTKRRQHVALALRACDFGEAGTLPEGVRDFLAKNSVNTDRFDRLLSKHRAGHFDLVSLYGGKELSVSQGNEAPDARLIAQRNETSDVILMEGWSLVAKGPLPR